MGDTKIEWATRVWNPVTGCDPVGEGCRNCYAARMASRLAGRFGYPTDTPFSVTLHNDRLDEPFHWKGGQRIFVCSMGDLFYESVPHEFIARVFDVTRGFGSRRPSPSQHVFMFLTKRPVAMKHHYLRWLNNSNCSDVPSNVWLGVSVENQETADDRIPVLLDTHAEKRFVSIEPCLGPIDLTSVWARMPSGGESLWNALNGPDRLDWVIAGGESGPGARPMPPDWAWHLRDQCFAAKVPFFFKQWGEWAGPCEAQYNPALCEGKPYIDVEPMSRSRGGCMPNFQLFRVGKKAAGCLLDGREWKEFPKGKAVNS